MWGYCVWMKTITLCVVLLLLTAGCGSSSSGSNGKELARADFGADWPLTVDAGIVSCENGGQVLFTVGKKTYAVNGTATMQRKELPDVAKIWADDPDGSGNKIDITPIIDAGLKLC